MLFDLLIPQSGMGVVTVPSSASRTPLGLSTRFSTRESAVRRPVILSLKKDNKTKKPGFVAPRESKSLAVEPAEENEKRIRTVRRARAVSTGEASPSSSELDYNVAAATLENIYKRSSTEDVSDVEVKDHVVKRRRQRRKRVGEAEEEVEKGTNDTIVRSRRKKEKRLSLEKRIAPRMKKEGEVIASSREGKCSMNYEDEKVDRLVREYSVSSDLVSLDWKKMKVPSVLPSSEHAWLFKLMQPMKVSKSPPPLDQMHKRHVLYSVLDLTIDSITYLFSSRILSRAI